MLRRISHWFGTLAAAVAALFNAGAAIAQQSASGRVDPTAFTEALADRFRQAQSGWSVIVKGPLTLSITPGSARGPIEASLDRLYSVCVSDPPQCDRVVSDFVARSADLVAPGKPAEITSLRAVLRPSAYLNTVRRAIPGDDRAPIAVPFVGDLWTVVMVDAPQTMRLAHQDDLRTLGLSADDAIAVGRRNVVAALGPLRQRASEPKPGGYQVVAGDAYDSSRLLDLDGWADFAAALNGNLVVAIPSAEKLMIGSGANATEIAAFSNLVQDAYRKAERQISSAVFKWTPTGWVPVSTSGGDSRP